MEKVHSNQFSGSNDLLTAQQHLMRIEHQLSVMHEGKEPKTVGEYSLIQKMAKNLRPTVYDIGHAIKNSDDSEEIHELYARILKTINSIIGREFIEKPNRVSE